MANVSKIAMAVAAGFAIAIAGGCSEQKPPAAPKKEPEKQGGMSGQQGMSGMGGMSGQQGMGGMTGQQGMGGMSGQQGMGGMTGQQGMGGMSGQPAPK